MGLILVGCAPEIIDNSPNNELEEEIKDLINGANFCNTVDDCSISQFGCPFGCNSIINKNHDLKDINELIQQYHDENNQLCQYTCVQPPEDFVCANNICIIKENNEDECISNEDCAVGGCSNQVCGKKGEVEILITTCEFREEYACFSKTSCGCFQGKCDWEENEEYQDCLESLE